MNEFSDLADRRLASRACRFCAAMRASEPQGPEWRPVLEDDLGVVVPSVGALAPGWLLVVPRDHALSVAALPARAAHQLEMLGERARTAVARSARSVAMFEHGPHAPASTAGCGVDHAHLHVAPFDAELLLEGARWLFPDVRFVAADDVRQAARQAIAGRRDYVALYGRDGAGHIATAPVMPSQLFRQVIAAAQGRPHEYDWRAFPRLDDVAATLDLVEGGALLGG